jgi:DNA invertase Pin-like site-specific DNA recombinase
MSRMMAVFAALERDLTSERTAAALAVKKAQGVQLGQPSKVTPDARKRLKALRQKGFTWTAIANQMNADGIPCGSGVPAWTAATARRLCP